ncbi:hypothetical protein DFH08DRAFT_1021098 [Mycena albidolilacea]|uniref:Uncharacterized protein n=1 Tax=Mycena albidolilacea TaxID=1033008 RepID=A0AAD6ZQW0_9AGAR|nr:hypothetical protein DFH08DRAFT_1021098 [Mycena albidolilacea]
MYRENKLVLAYLVRILFPRYLGNLKLPQSDGQSGLNPGDLRKIPSLLARISQRELSLATFGSAAPVAPAPGETETMIAIIAMLLISYDLLSNGQVPQELQSVDSVQYISSAAICQVSPYSQLEVFSKRSDIPVVVLAQLYLTELRLGAPTSEEKMLVPNLEPVSLPAVRKIAFFPMTVLLLLRCNCGHFILERLQAVDEELLKVQQRQNRLFLSIPHWSPGTPTFTTDAERSLALTFRRREDAKAALDTIATIMYVRLQGSASSHRSISSSGDSYLISILTPYCILVVIRRRLSHVKTGPINACTQHGVPYGITDGIS